MIGGMTMIANRRNRMGMRLATVNYSVAASTNWKPNCICSWFFFARMVSAGAVPFRTSLGRGRWLRPILGWGGIGDASWAI